MDATIRIETALDAALMRAEADRAASPPRLAEALRYAVFPGGARIRPRLCLSVALACGDDAPDAANAAAAAIECLHTASLIHDDLPCFDNAGFRRNRPSVHLAFGEPLAVLAGDALIVLAFQVLAWNAAFAGARLAPLVRIIGDSAGMPGGIVAGQAWECEPEVELAAYQQAKTGALFAAATMAGAAAAGGHPEEWRILGEKLGEAYQVADDLRDAICAADEMGKPRNQDIRCNRPSAVRRFGIEGAARRLDELTTEAEAAIPDCPGAASLRALIRSEGERLPPRQLSPAAA
jgi:geranylgeranyl diphosphate synthase type II